MSRYAKDTSVSVANSKAEIERIVERYGASQFMSGWDANKAIIAFAMEGRQVRFILPMPARDDEEFTTYMRGSVKYLREDGPAREKWEQACRQRWRALALVVKAKLEAVEIGISTFEHEFLANIILPNGRTVADETLTKIAEAYAGKGMPNLLPDYSGGAR